MKKHTKIILIVILLTTMFIIMPQTVKATSGGTEEITPGQFKGDDPGSDIKNDFNDTMDKVEKMVKTAGAFISVGGLMIIGIKYMTGSLEEKAQYKKSMMPYIIGCILIFGATYLGPEILDLFRNKESGEEMGSAILGLIQVVGTFISVGIVMVLGVKYMVGTTDERASYKKTMIPYVIGAILLFSAVTIASYVAEVAEEITNSGGQGTGEPGSMGVIVINDDTRII